MNPVNSQHLYIFLDESGNFDFSMKGTKFFTITAITRLRPFLWESPLLELKYQLLESGLDLEYFHASEDSQRVRNQVFRIIGENLSRIDSVIIEKRKTGPALQKIELFFPRMIGYLLRFILQSWEVQKYSKVVVITHTIPLKKKKEVIEKSIKKVLSSMLPSGITYQIFHHSSRSCFGLQVTDYCNWAIFRKWEVEDNRSYDLVKLGIKSEFDIFRTGTRFYY